jgi:hypothetical protein
MPYASKCYQQNVLCITTLTTICVSYHNSDNNMSIHIVVSVVIRKSYCCQWCDTYDILLSVLWYVWHIVVMVVIRKIYCCKCQHYVLRITTLTTICLMCHKTDNNMSYVRQHWQPYLIPGTTLTTICLTYHNTDNNMSYVSSVLWYVRHIVVNVVKRKTCCCQCCDT